MPIQKEVAPFFSHLTRGDKILIGALIACALLSLPLTRALTKAGRFVQIETDGHVLRVVDLAAEQIIEVPGPLGVTTVVVNKRRVRVASDPGIHQYCVRQGWLERAGEIAICAPNEVSVQVQGGKESYDSLSY